MPFPIPKIQYNPGTGIVNLPFTFPPINKAGAPELEARNRSDSISLSGLKQTIFTGVDEFLPVQMDYVPQVDLPAWEDFFQWAVTGGLFNYYPDATLSGFTTYTLEDVKWTPSRNFRTMAKFTMRMRKVVGSDQAGS